MCNNGRDLVRLEKKTFEHGEGRRASKQYRALEKKLQSSTYDTRSKLAKIADLVDMPLLPSESSKQSFRGVCQTAPETNFATNSEKNNCVRVLSY